MGIRKFIYLFFAIIFFVNLNANVIYEKNNKIITDLDIKIYKQLYKENYGSDINNMNALKDLILIKGVIEDLIKKNPDFIEKIDNELLKQFGPKPLENENIRMDIIKTELNEVKEKYGDERRSSIEYGGGDFRI